jgi:hypothetical protein
VVEPVNATTTYVDDTRYSAVKPHQNMPCLKPVFDCHFGYWTYVKCTGGVVFSKSRSSKSRSLPRVDFLARNEGVHHFIKSWRRH